MKKIYLAFACFALVLAGVSTAFAADTDGSQSGGAGATFSIANSSGDGAPTFDFSPSPNIVINSKSIATAYAIESTNSVTDTTNGMVYGATYQSSGYAQRQKVDSESATPSSSTQLDSETWTWMGGSS